MNTSDYQTDVLILGSGAAGLTVALRLPETVRVTIITKGPMHEGASLYAQGGISAVWDKDDSIEEHVQDTLIAGAGLCDPNAARFVAERSRSCIEWLLSAKVPFSTRVSKHGETELHLTREGGHSQRRIVHAADATGRAVETTLVSAVNARDNIQVLENHLAVDLITGRRLGLPDNRIHGAYILNLDDDSVQVLSATYVVLATGGASQVYLNSTTPAGATGDGIAMAWRAGARVANMEFNQFHPTSLYSKSGQPFLISEAVRGEGGQLKLPNGERFMPRFDDRAELAPRDIVARAIDHEMKRLGADCVFLDISHRDGDFIRDHFPTIHQRCLDEGIDISREPIPVVPAAHYTCGGVIVRMDGQTDIPGLFAVGEVAYTGLHGANRLASNSLLECIVFATEAAASITRQISRRPESAPAMPTWDDRLVVDSDERVVVSHNWAELRRFMWDYVGIVRTDKRLARARRRIDLLLSEIEEYYGNFRVTADLLQLRNMATVADLIIRSAQARPESRGLHFNLDHPDTDPSLDGHPTVLVPAPPRPYRQLK